MSVGERRFFRRFRRLNNRRSGDRLAIAAGALSRAMGLPARFSFSDCEPAPSAKRSRRPMRGAFRSSRFVLPLCVGGGASRCARDPQGRSIGGCAPHWAWAGLGAARRRAPFDAGASGLGSARFKRVGKLRGFGRGQRRVDRRGLALGRCPRRRRRLPPPAFHVPVSSASASASALATAARRSRPQRAVVFVGGGGGELQKLGAHVAQLGVEDAADLLVAPAQIILDVEALVAFQRELDQNARLAF